MASLGLEVETLPSGFSEDLDKSKYDDAADYAADTAYFKVEDVARTMESCAEPNRTYSMMDEYNEEMERDKCYVNPFVGEGR